MIRQLRMTAFHLRQFVSIPYFIQLMVITTVTTTLIQYLGAEAWGTLTPTQGWVRAGVIGCWTTTTTAAGIIGFERYKGTLPYLVLAPIGALRSLAAVVCSAASFGLAALPLAWATWALLSWSVDFTLLSWSVLGQLIAGTLMLEIASISLALVIAALFILTPNAITYEELLLVPVMIGSGLLSTATTLPAWLEVTSTMLPLRLPFEMLMGATWSLAELALWIAVVLAWLGIAALAGRRALVKATQLGTLEVI